MKAAPRPLPSSAGISSVAYRLPKGRWSLERLHRAGALRSSPGTLRNFGFRRAYVEPDREAFEELIIDAGREALHHSRTEVEALLVYSALNPSERRSRGRGDRTLEAFRYPAARIAQRLNIGRATALGLSQQGCSGLLSALDLAGKVAGGSDDAAVLCVAADALPAGGSREIMYNVMSDAACAAVVDKASPRNRIVGFHQRSEAAYWDTPRLEQELIAAYFPMAQRTILDALEQARLSKSAIRWLVPSNVSLRSWTILADLLDIPIERVWTHNIARVGHTVCCDHIINLADMERSGALTPGDLMLLFTFGFGASWSVLILRH